MKRMDKFTKKPIQSTKEFELYRDLEYLIRTGKHRRPTEIRWKRPIPPQKTAAFPAA